MERGPVGSGKIFWGQKAEKEVKNGHFGVCVAIFCQNQLFARHENSQNSLSRGLIVVLKVTVYRRTSLENYSEKAHVMIFGQKVKKTGFIPPILGGKWVQRGVWVQRVKQRNLWS